MFINQGCEAAEHYYPWVQEAKGVVHAGLGIFAKWLQAVVLTTAMCSY